MLVLGVVAVLAFFAAVVWHARTVFLLEIQDGRVKVRKGRPPPGFANACEDVCRLYRIERGRIRGVRAPGGIQLRFSSDIPERTRQPFRNVWTPPPRGGGGGGAARAR